MHLEADDRLIFPSKPQGCTRPGRPAILTDTVQISPAYISSGLVVLEPISYAVVGATGVRMTSHLSNALANSSRILRCAARAFL